MRHKVASRSRRYAQVLGYTLVELLLVVVIISVGGAIVVAASGAQRTERVRAAARVLASDIRFARSWSLANRADTAVLVVDIHAPGYRIARASDPGVPITDPISHAAYERVFGPGPEEVFNGVSFGTLDIGGDDRLGFTPRGHLDQGANATMTLTGGGTSYTIIIDGPTGEAVIQ